MMSRASVLVGVLLLGACTDTPTEPEPVAAALQMSSDFPRMVQCGEDVATPFRVRAVDAAGNGVAGVRVTFHPWLLEPSPAILSATEARTDAAGYAEVRVKAPPPVSPRYSTFSAQAAELQISALASDSAYISRHAHCLDLVSLTLSSDTIRVPADGRQRFGLDADPRDSLGQRIRVVTVDFEVLDPTVLRLSDGSGSGSGRMQNRSYFPLKPGVTRVVASLLGLSDTAYVEVTAVP